MKFRSLCAAALGAAVLAAPMAATSVQAAGDQFVPLLVYRTGPYAPNGIPLADGFNDYMQLLQTRDGGINGVPLSWEECETQYNNDRGVEFFQDQTVALGHRRLSIVDGTAGQGTDDRADGACGGTHHEQS